LAKGAIRFSQNCEIQLGKKENLIENDLEEYPFLNYMMKKVKLAD